MKVGKVENRCDTEKRKDRECNNLESLMLAVVVHLTSDFCKITGFHMLLTIAHWMSIGWPNGGARRKNSRAGAFSYVGHILAVRYARWFVPVP
jgi:hypothetical protein